MFHSSKAISLQIQFWKHAFLKRVINVPQLSHCFQQGGQNTTVEFNIPKGEKKLSAAHSLEKSAAHRTTSIQLVPGATTTTARSYS